MFLMSRLSDFMHKKNLLIFTLSPPLPANSGAPIYIKNTLIPLSEKYNLHLYTIGGGAEIELIKKYRSEYDRYFCSVHVEPRVVMPSQKSLIGKIVHGFVHVWYGLPFMDASYYSGAAVKSAKKIIRQHNIHAMEIHTGHLAFFKKFIPTLPAVLISHNIESDIFPFWIPQHVRGWRKVAIEFIAKISRRNADLVELKNIWKFDAMTFLSRNDMDRVTNSVFKRYIPLCLPVKMNIDYSMRQAAPVKVLWMGGFWWYPNAEGVLWFVENIFPLIKGQLVQNNIELHFLGDAPPRELKAIADNKNVFVHGFVESIDSMLAVTHILFVPLLSGGGVRIKILEAMSNGIPVLSTSKGCEGIGARDGVEVLIRDEPSEFALALVALASDPEMRGQMSLAGRQFLNEKYNLEAYIREKDNIYQMLTSSPSIGAGNEHRSLKND